MDCCNYMQYRHHQPYYGSQYYHEPLPPYHGEFYGQHVYHDYYGNIGNTPYYPPQHWQPAGTFVTPDYVYNPKEARIRKAMREATRDRSIGASPMLPRPSARRAASQGWATAPHEDQLMMSPMAAAGMRRALDSPVCFPMPGGTGSSQFMPPPMSTGYGKLESPLPPPPPPATGSSVHTNYMQPNPLAQLQQHTEMWHNFQDDMRPRSSGNPYMMQDVPPPFQHQPSPPLSIPSPMMMDKQRLTPHALHPLPTPPLSNISMTPPHSNENVPPDEALQMCKAAGCTEEGFESKHIIDPSVHPLMESNMQQNDGFMPAYGQNMAAQPQFEKVEDIKMKKIPSAPHVCPKNPSCKNMLYLPLSCTNFCASPDLFTNNTEYQREYITKYFQSSSDYDVLNFMTEDGDSFPYATFSNSLENKYLYDDSPQPNFIQTDVGYIPIMFDSNRSSAANSIKCENTTAKK